MDYLEREQVRAEAIAAAAEADGEGRFPPPCPYPVDSPKGRVFLNEVDAYADRMLGAEPSAPDLDGSEDLLDLDDGEIVLPDELTEEE